MHPGSSVAVLFARRTSVYKALGAECSPEPFARALLELAARAS